jgi:D-alanyl-D-alanine carboxypeptidase (penicillin-binding protein 5/6)
VATTNIQKPIVAPIQVGQVLGEVNIHLAGELVATKQLVAIEAVEKGSWWRQLLDMLLMLIWG